MVEVSHHNGTTHGNISVSPDLSVQHPYYADLSRGYMLLSSLLSPLCIKIFGTVVSASEDIWEPDHIIMMQHRSDIYNALKTLNLAVKPLSPVHSQVLDFYDSKSTFFTSLTVVTIEITKLNL